MSGNERLAECVAEIYGKPRRPTTPPFTPAEEAAIYDKYINGSTIQRLADDHQCSTKKVSTAIHREHRKRERR